MPTHIKRIRSAIDDLPSAISFEVGDSIASTTNANESGLPDSQDTATNIRVSQGREFKTSELPRAKKARLQPKTMLGQENERLREQNVQLMDLLKGQEDRQKEQMDRQIEELKRERDEQKQQIQSLIAALAVNTRPHAS